MSRLWKKHYLNLWTSTGNVAKKDPDDDFIYKLKDQLRKNALINKKVNME